MAEIFHIKPTVMDKYSFKLQLVFTLFRTILYISERNKSKNIFLRKAHHIYINEVKHSLGILKEVLNRQ